MASSGNFCTWNPLRVNQQTQTFAEGNTRFSSTQTSTNPAVTGTFGVTSGKWYWEIKIVNYGNASNSVGVCRTSAGLEDDTGALWNATGDVVFMYLAGGNKRTNGSSSSYGNTWTTGDILQVALDMDNGAVYFGKNNTFQNSGDPTSGSSKTGAAFTNLADKGHIQPYSLVYNNGDQVVNFGQDDTFGGRETAAGNAGANSKGVFKYTPPSGYSALCSANLSIGTGIDPAGDDGADENPTKQFFMTEYLGNLSNRTITTENQADLIVIRHTNYAQNWYVVDSNRGITNNYYLKLDDNIAEATFPQSNFQSIGSTSVGISSGTWLNSTGAYYQMWMWHCNSGTTTSDSSGDITVTRQTNDASKFSILTYTGSGSSGNTIAHGLGVKPAMTWIKQRNSSNSWNVWHQGYNSGDYDSFGELNNSASWNANQGSNGPYTAAPGTDYLTLTAYGQVNGSSNTYVAYVWADVEGMQKFGNYTGNGNADGPFIYTGFRPRMLFLKSTDTSDDWIVIDTLRSTSNVTNNGLAFNNNNAETTSNRECDILSNGFKPRTSNTNLNKSGTNYIYGAWSDVPFKYNNTF